MTSSHTSQQSLKWTRPLLDELCDEIQQTLEQWADEETDSADIDLTGATEASRNIAGSLSVLEFDSGRLLGEAMAAVLEGLQGGTIDDDNQQAALNAVFEATATLPDYLDYLEHTHRDAPLVVLSVINELLTAVGETPLDESNFFRPPVETVVLPSPEAETATADDLRREYQKVLREHLVDDNDQSALDNLLSIGLKVRDQNAFPDSVRRAGWACAGLTSALMNGAVSTSPAVTRLLARFDGILKQLAENGEGIDEAADDLCCSFLFQLAMAAPGEGEAGRVYEAFGLAEHTPDQAKQARAFLAGQNRALFAAVTQAAREDLSQIKDTLGSQLEGAADPDLLEQQTTLLESVGESLAMLGLDALAVRIKAQAGRLSELSADPNDPALLSVARELLVVESQLEDSFNIEDLDEEPVEDGDQTAMLLPASEQRRVIRQLLAESHEDLSHAKSLLDAVNRGKADASAAEESWDVLDRVASALYMAELDDGAQLVDAARKLVQVSLIDGSESSSDKQLETLAEALTVAELYLDSMASLDEKGRAHFATARRNLEALGYWPGSEDVAAEPDPEPELGTPPSDDEVTEGEEAGADESTEEVEADHPADEFTEEAESDEPLEKETEDETTFEPDAAEAEPVSADDADEDQAASPETSAFDDFDIVEIFLEEFDQELEALKETLDQWRQSTDDKDIQTTIRRAFHSLKGSGRMAGATEIGEFSWKFENLMNQVLEGRLEPSTPVIDLVNEAIAALPSMRARLSNEGPVEHDEESCAELAHRADRAAEGEPAQASEDEAVPAGGAEVEGLDPTLIELMIKELSENLETLDDWLAQAEENGVPGIVEDPLVRAVHTMKGTMRLAPIGDESETAQLFEQYLEELTHAGTPPAAAGLEAIKQCRQLFRQRLDRLQGDQVDDEAFDTAELAQELRKLHSQVHRDGETTIGFGYRETSDEPEFPSDAASGTDSTAEDYDVFGLEEDGDSEAADEAAPETQPVGEEADAAAETGEGDEATLDEETEQIPAEAVEGEAGFEDIGDDQAVVEPEPEDAFEPVPEEASEPESEDVSEPAPDAEINYEELNEDLLEAFLEEAQEVLEHADESLQQWRETPEDKALMTGLQRDLHTIKGSSRMVGLEVVGSVAHVMEELLEGIAAGLHQVTPERIDALETGCDHLHAMIDAVAKRKPVPTKPITDLFAEQAEEIEEVETLPERIIEQEERSEQAAPVARTETLRVPTDLVDDLVNYAGEISIFRSRLEEQVGVFRTNVGEVDETVIRLRDQLRKLEIETEAQILARYEREHGPADEAFDPLELDRYSTIQQLSRALGESVNDLNSLISILDDATRQSETLLIQQSRVNTELQEGLMQARMVSFNTLLPRLRRVIRNAARDLGKQAQLNVHVEGEGELDRSVLDRITAPIEHLLRNAISHGIESPKERKKRDKPEAGSVNINVTREATELVMRISDDGGGLDLEAIERQGIDKGLIDSARSHDEDELAQLIFQPGFSTAEEVSELAGRGIGMDVVANEVRQIGGSVAAHTEAGQGTRFTIRIPLSLTVMQAIVVRVSDRQFAIPLQAVRGVTRMLASEWQRQINSDEPHQEYAGEDYPLLELEPQLGFETEELPEGTLSLLMIEAGDQRAALRVSELQGHREIVIKPVGPQISSITGILGGTITGDGQVVPILDMGPLIRQAFERDLLPGQVMEREEAQPASHEEAKRTPLVLVVDDSITMRRVTARVLEHRGLEVLTARDGLDAVETMFERVPDLILLDIEMPRMDGYELATHVRNEARLKDVPMIMVTSRGGEKHRQHAKQLGVEGYLTKPYQEGELVENVFEQLKMPVPEG